MTDTEMKHIQHWNREDFDGGYHVDGKFSNDWRFEMKSIDGDTFYSLNVPITELDDWAEHAPIEDWTFIPLDDVIEDLRESLQNIDELGELKEEAETFPVIEFGSLFESLEREKA